ncbi:MAG: hypothetical protein ACLQT6_11445 [Desulfomonilaceae bacterium]
MMRVVVTPLLIWIIGMGGLSLYMHTREVAQAQKTVEMNERRSPAGTFGLDITLSFTAQPDSFEVKTHETDKPTSLIVRLNGKEILRRYDEVAAGIPVLVEPVKGLVDGVNEFYVESSPPSGEAPRAQAVRLRCFRDGKELTEHTYWTEVCTNMSAIFSINLRTDPQRKGTHEP